MAFNRTKLAQIAVGDTNGVVPVFWSYKSLTETLATIVASAYFNSASDVLTQYDLIYIVGSDARALYAITSATGATPVTVAAV